MTAIETLKMLSREMAGCRKMAFKDNYYFELFHKWLTEALAHLQAPPIDFEPKTKAAWTIKNVLEKARETHRKWVAYLQAVPGAESNVVETAGSTLHHKKCIERYDKALEALYYIQTQLEAQPESMNLVKDLRELLGRIGMHHQHPDYESWIADIVTGSLEACARLDRQETELEEKEAENKAIMRRAEAAESDWQLAEAENKRLKGKIDLALLELAHIEGEKNPTEIRIEQALK